MNAAIKLYHIREAEEFKAFSSAILHKPQPITRRGTSTGSRLWFWGKRRWGINFIKEEYRIRELT